MTMLGLSQQINKGLMLEKLRSLSHWQIREEKQYDYLRKAFDKTQYPFTI